MEPTFETKKIRYLQEILHKTVRREETAETVVPDGEPDPERVLACSANAFLRSKECRTGRAELSGGIQADVTYLCAGERQPRSLSVYLPFSVNLEDTMLEPESKLKVCMFVRGADARITHSRRIQTRVSLVLTVRAYAETETSILCPENVPEVLQMKTVVYPMLLPVDYAETTIHVDEDILLPSGDASSAVVLLCTIEPILTESRVAGDKAVFQGDLRLHILYQSGGETPSTYERKIPFSQYCTLNEVYENADADFCIVLTGCEFRGGANADGTLSVDADLLVQCTVYDRVPVPICEDAYAVYGVWEPEWREYTFRDRLDLQSLGSMMQESADITAASVTDVITFCDNPEMERMENTVRISVPVTVQILYYDTNGELQRCILHGKPETEMQLAQSASCEAIAAPGETAVQLTGAGISVSCPLRITAECCTDQAYRSICGGKLSEETEPEKRPAVILKSASAGESLWKLAKQYRSTAEKIARANGISGESLQEPMTVLIPM